MDTVLTCVGRTASPVKDSFIFLSAEGDTDTGRAVSENNSKMAGTSHFGERHGSRTKPDLCTRVERHSGLADASLGNFTSG